MNRCMCNRWISFCRVLIADHLFVAVFFFFFFFLKSILEIGEIREMASFSLRKDCEILPVEEKLCSFAQPVPR